jgi:hypothetical protein
MLSDPDAALLSGVWGVASGAAPDAAGCAGVCSSLGASHAIVQQT